MSFSIYLAVSEWGSITMALGGGLYATTTSKLRERKSIQAKRDISLQTALSAPQEPEHAIRYRMMPDGSFQALQDTFWLDVVGIPLDVWHSAKGEAQVAALCARRAAGEFKRRPKPGHPAHIHPAFAEKVKKYQLRLQQSEAFKSEARPPDVDPEAPPWNEDRCPGCDRENYCQCEEPIGVWRSRWRQFQQEYPQDARSFLVTGRRGGFDNKLSFVLFRQIWADLHGQDDEYVTDIEATIAYHTSAMTKALSIPGPLIGDRRGESYYEMTEEEMAPIISFNGALIRQWPR